MKTYQKKLVRFIEKPQKKSIVKVYDDEIGENLLFFGKVIKTRFKYLYDREEKKKVKRQIVVLKKLNYEPHFNEIDYFLPNYKTELC